MSLQSQIVDEVTTKLTDFQSKLSGHLREQDARWDMYDAIPYIQRRDKESENMAKASTSTTSEAVETITHTLYTMLTAADPNFELVSVTGQISESALFKNTQFLKLQMQKINYKRKLLKLLRSLTLNGTAFVYQPWVSWPYGDPDPAWESCDFVPLALNQVFWSHTAADLEKSDYFGMTDIVSPGHLRVLSGADEEGAVWIRENIDLAIKESGDKETFNEEVKMRLTKLGYSDFSKHWEYIAYWGKLEAIGDNNDYVVGIVNRKYLVRFHASPYPNGVFPIRPVRYLEVDNDPLGRGIGHQLKYPQRLINSNLNRTMDAITFGLFNMMIGSKYNGIDTRKMRPRPWLYLEAEDPNSIVQMKPDLQSAAMGLKLHELLLDQARNDTGATSTLQAVITEASASEVRIAQNNSIRRASNVAEVIGESLIRDTVWFMNLNNFMFVDAPVWLRDTGSPKPLMLYPSEISKNVDPTPRIITDKDFAPQAVKNSLQLLQIITSVRNMIPGDVDVRPIIASIIRRQGEDPAKVFTGQAPPPNLAALQTASGQGGVNRALADRTSPPTPQEQFINAQAGLNVLG